MDRMKLFATSILYIYLEKIFHVIGLLRILRIKKPFNSISLHLKRGYTRRRINISRRRFIIIIVNIVISLDENVFSYRGRRGRGGEKTLDRKNFFPLIHFNVCLIFCKEKSLIRFFLISDDYFYF